MEIDNKNHDELINRYISGKMTEQEKSDFLTSLETNDSLRQRAQLVGLIAQEIHHVNSEDSIIDAISKTDKDNFRKKLQHLREEKCGSNVAACSIDDGLCIRKDEYKKKRIIRRTILSIAASIVVIIGIFSIYQHFSSPDYAVLGSKQQVITTFRGSTINEHTEIAQAIQDDKDIKSILPQLSQYYWDNDDKALKPFHDDIGWNLAIAYLKINDKENAIKVLNNIIKESSSDAHIEQAKKLLNEINNL